MMTDLLPFAALVPTLGLLVIVHVIARRYRKVSRERRALMGTLIIIAGFADNPMHGDKQTLGMIQRAARHELNLLGVQRDAAVNSDGDTEAVVWHARGPARNGG